LQTAQVHNLSTKGCVVQISENYINPEL